MCQVDVKLASAEMSAGFTFSFFAWFRASVPGMLPPTFRVGLALSANSLTDRPEAVYGGSRSCQVDTQGEKKQTANQMKNRRLRVAETRKGWIALLLSLDVRAPLPLRSPAWSFFHSWGF